MNCQDDFEWRLGAIKNSMDNLSRLASSVRERYQFELSDWAGTKDGISFLRKLESVLNLFNRKPPTPKPEAPFRKDDQVMVRDDVAIRVPLQRGVKYVIDRVWQNEKNEWRVKLLCVFDESGQGYPADMFEVASVGIKSKFVAAI